jgi:hypothetical protein
MLCINGPRTELELVANHHGRPLGWQKAITGRLNDLSEVTLLDCVLLSSSTKHMGDDSITVDKWFPHFVAIGNNRIDPHASSISDVMIAMDDATSIFYDFDAFGLLLCEPDKIADVINSSRTGRRVTMGCDPIVAYFSGKHEIFSVATKIGDISVHHAPSHGLGGPGGINISNRIVLRFTPVSSISFEAAVDALSRILAFFGVIAGRVQDAAHFSVKLKNSRPGDLLDVHWSRSLRRRQHDDEDEATPHPADVLINTAESTSEMAAVVRAWFDIDDDRRDARQRFFSSFAKGRYYSVDRLVAAANTFDILPPSAFPARPELAAELRHARDASRGLFRALPSTYDRDSILSALGRMGTLQLKGKVHHRFSLLNKFIGNRFPDLAWTLDRAVDGRNHYVHGTESAVDFSKSGIIEFLTDSLEFVFAASDLLDCGWDLKRYLSTGTTMSHRFGQYRVNYAAGLQNLRNAAL